MSITKLSPELLDTKIKWYNQSGPTNKFWFQLYQNQTLGSSNGSKVQKSKSKS